MKSSYISTSVLLFVLILFSGCSITQIKDFARKKSSYQKIDFIEFENLDSLKKIYAKDQYTLYSGLTANLLTQKIDERLILEVENRTKTNYFLLDKNVLFLHDNLIIPDLYFIYSSSDETTKNGQWLKAEFEQRKTSFSYDELPKNHKELSSNIIEPGIYLYQDGLMKKVCDDQSSRCFYKNKISGTYFIPYPGTFYLILEYDEVK